MNYRLLAEHCHDMIVRVGPDGRRRYVSPACRKLLGYEPEELVGRSGWELAHPEDQPGMRAALARACAGVDRAASNVYRLRHRSGCWIWVESTFSAYDRGGSPEVVVVVRNVSRRMATLAALEESERRYRLLAENADDVILCAGLDGRARYLSPSGGAILGYRAEDLPDSAILDIVHPEELEPALSALAGLVAGGQSARCEQRVRHRDGRYLWMENSMRLVTGPEGDHEVVAVLREIGDRKRTEEALRESVALNRSVVESSADCIMVLDPGGRLLFMNGPGREVMEIDDFAQVRGRDWAEYWPLGIRPQATDAVAQARDGRASRFAAPGPTTRGTAKWWDVLVTPVLGPDRGIERLVAIARDVTAQKATELQLKDATRRARSAEAQAAQAQQRLEDAIEALPEGFALFDAEDRLVICNDMVRRLYAGSAHAFVPGDSYETMVRAVAEHTFRIRSSEAEIADWIAQRLDYHRNPTGAVEAQLLDGRWVRFEERPTRDGGRVGLRVDITDLKTREASFKLLFENNPVPMWVFDRETLRFLKVNRAAIAQYGYSVQAFETMGIHDVREADDFTEWRARIAALVSGESTFRRAVRHRRADGSIIDVDVQGHALDFEGRPAILTANFDVTARNWAGAELLKAKEAAEAASRAKSQFLANMSHELRTPLNSIIGFAEIIGDALMGPVSDRYRSYAGDIRGSGLHLLSVINDILDLSKVEADRLDLHDETIDIADLVEACRQLMAPRAQQGGVELTVELPRDLPPVRADRLRLKQVLLNLLSNATKFTRPGGRVNVDARIDADGALSLTVTDTGIGMRAEDIALALEPFRQIDDVLSRRFEGTGLGLPLAKRLIELHDGRLQLDSEPGRGTRATASLPPERVRTPPAS